VGAAPNGVGETVAAGAPKIFCVGVEANAAGADEKPNAVGAGAAAGLGKPPAPNAVAAGAAEGPVRPKPTAPKGAGAAPKGAGVPDAAVGMFCPIASAAAFASAFAFASAAAFALASGVCGRRSSGGEVGREKCARQHAAAAYLSLSHNLHKRCV
jgi:hypothetical protein